MPKPIDSSFKSEISITRSLKHKLDPNEKQSDEKNDASSVSSSESSSVSSNKNEIGKNHIKFLTVTSSQPFPQQLMKILARKDFKSIISWHPSGQYFLIYKKDKLMEIVAPSYFQITKYDSLRRKLNRWGFSLMKEGSEAAFHHKVGVFDKSLYFLTLIFLEYEFFKRDNPSLCVNIKCEKRKKNPENLSDTKKILQEKQDPSKNQNSYGKIGYFHYLALQEQHTLWLKRESYLINEINEFEQNLKLKRVGEGSSCSSTHASSIPYQKSTIYLPDSFLRQKKELLCQNDAIVKNIVKPAKKRLKTRKDEEEIKSETYRGNLQGKKKTRNDSIEPMKRSSNAPSA